MGGSSVLVSVIVPVYNDLESLGCCLQALQNQQFPQSQYEILVVDNGSEADVAGLVNKYATVSYLYEGRPGSYAARNKGVNHAQGKYLAFTDADCEPASDWLAAGLKALQPVSESSVVAGRVDVLTEAGECVTAFAWFDHGTYLNQQRKSDEHYAATANLFIARELFSRVGPFDERLRSGGDREWGERAYAMGVNILYCEAACVRHPARSSFAQLSHKVKRVYGGMLHLAWRAGFWHVVKLVAQTAVPPVSRMRDVMADDVMSLSLRLSRAGVIWLMKGVALVELLRLLGGGRALR